MSINVMSWYWKHSKQEGHKLLALLALADWCTEDGECYPSMKALAARIRRDERSAQRVVSELEKANELLIYPGMGKGQDGRRSPLYYLVKYRDANDMQIEPMIAEAAKHYRQIDRKNGRKGIEVRKAQAPLSGDTDVTPTGDTDVTPTGDTDVTPTGDTDVTPTGDTDVTLIRHIDPSFKPSLSDQESDRARAAPTPADSSRRRLDPPSANTEQPTPATDTSAVVRLQQILPTRNGSTPTVVGGRDRRSNAEYDTVCKAIESNGFGMMTPILADKVNAFMDAYPTDWIIRALATATAANKLRLDYVGGILENWKREGFGYDQRHHHRERGRNGVHPPATDSAADSRQRAYNERYTRLLADEINQVITRDAAAQQWEQLETEFPDYEYKELP